MHHTPSSRPAVLATSGLLAAALLSACGGGPDDRTAASPLPSVTAAPTTAPATTAAPPAPVASSAAPVPSTAPSTAPSRTTPAGPAACPSSRLAVTVRDGEGAAGSTYENIVFVNQGTVTCTLSGHPGVSYVVGKAGTQVGAPAARSGEPALVTLAPGGSAHAQLRIVNYQNIDRETCQSSPVDGFRIYPPDQTASQFVAQPGTTCADPSVAILSVEPVVLGAG